MLNQWVSQRRVWWEYALQITAAGGAGLILGAASLKFSPLWVLLGLAGVAFLIALAHHPELGLVVIVGIVSLAHTEKLPLLKLGPMSLHITDLVLVFLLGLIVVRALAEADFKLVRTPLDIPVVWFYLAVLSSVVVATVNYSVDPTFAIRRLRPLTYYLAFFVVTNLVRTRRQMAILLAGLFIVGVLGATALIIQVLFPSVQLINTEQPELVTAGQTYAGVVRIYTEVDRLTYLLLGVSICLLVMKSKWFAPPLELACAIILGVSLVLSFQRNYWLSTLFWMALLVFLVSWPQKFRFMRWMVSIPLLVVLVMPLWPDNQFERYIAAASDRLFRGMSGETLAEDSSTQMRVTETRYALQKVQQHPLQGIGLGNVYRPWLPRDAFGSGLEDRTLGLRWYMHNAYLWVLVAGGLFELVPFVLMYATATLRGLYYWRQIENSFMRAVLLGLTLALTGQMISNFVSPNFVQTWALISFAIALGIIELILRWEVYDRRPQEVRAIQ